MGLFVLVGFIAYILLAKYMANTIGKYSESNIAKYIAIAAFVLVPTWDSITGWLYFEQLCSTQAEIRVLKTVEEEQENFLSNGQPDGRKLSDRYGDSFSSDRQFSTVFSIEKLESALRNKQTGETLGTTKEFIFRGGWLTRFVLPEAMYICRKYEYSGAHAILWREVIKPKANSVKGAN